MQKNAILGILEEMPLDKDYRGIPGLRELALRAGIQMSNKAKRSFLTEKLMQFYANPNSLKNIFSTLCKGDQLILSFMSYTKGKSQYSDLMQFVKENNLKKREASHYAVRMSDYFSENSKAWLFMPNGMMCIELSQALDEAVGPYRICTQEVTDQDLQVLERQDCMDDFVKLVRYCNQSSVAVTKNGLLSKSGAVAFAKLAGYRELTESMSANPEDARTLQKMRVTFGLYLLAVTGGLIRMENGKAVPGTNATELLTLPDEELAKRLYTAYQKDKTIREVAFMTGVKEAMKKISYPAARGIIERTIRKYPAGKLLFVGNLIAEMRLCNRDFLQKTQESVVYTGNNTILCEFDDVEIPFIHMVLSVYGALGMLDIGWGLREVKVALAYSDESELLCVPVAFRITPLGQWIWGQTDSYKPLKKQEPKAGGRFLVQPDFSIMLAEGAARIGHELYFERFLKKKSDDAQMTVYKLDVQGVLSALNLGITVDELTRYLESGAENPLPENVRRTLADWAEMSQKIRIRSVSILETDDPVLLEELLHLKGMGELTSGRIRAAAVVAPGAAPKIKKLIEKNNRYCKDEFTR